MLTNVEIARAALQAVARAGFTVEPNTRYQTGGGCTAVYAEAPRHPDGTYAFVMLTDGNATANLAEAESGISIFVYLESRSGEDDGVWSGYDGVPLDEIEQAAAKLLAEVVAERKVEDYRGAWAVDGRVKAERDAAEIDRGLRENAEAETPETPRIVTRSTIVVLVGSHVFRLQVAQEHPFGLLGDRLDWTRVTLSDYAGDWARVTLSDYAGDWGKAGDTVTLNRAWVVGIHGPMEDVPF